MIRNSAVEHQFRLNALVEHLIGFKRARNEIELAADASHGETAAEAPIIREHLFFRHKCHLIFDKLFFNQLIFLIVRVRKQNFADAAVKNIETRRWSVDIHVPHLKVGLWESVIPAFGRCTLARYDHHHWNIEQVPIMPDLEAMNNGELWLGRRFAGIVFLHAAVKSRRGETDAVNHAPEKGKLKRIF
ncbi:MAG: hypothetical protein AAGF58_04035 [Pseudomonadota bacterium]